MRVILCTHVTLYTSNLQGPRVWEVSWSLEILVSVYVCLRWRMLWKNTDLHKHGLQNVTTQVVTASMHLQCSSQRRALTSYNLQYKLWYYHVNYCNGIPQCTDVHQDNFELSRYQWLPLSSNSVHVTFKSFTAALYRPIALLTQCNVSFVSLSWLSIPLECCSSLE